MTDGERKATRERVQLQDRKVKALQPRPKNYTVWDDEQRGLGVQVTPQGTKTFVWKYTHGRQQRWVRIGAHPAWSVEQARAHVRKLRMDLDMGEDPAETIKARREEETVKGLATRFLAEHVSAKRKGRTLTDYKGILDTYVVPMLGAVKVREVQAHHVAELHASMSEKPYRANRALAVLSSMLSLAETWGMRSPNSNPCKTVERYPEQKRTNFLKTEELARLLDVLKANEDRCPQTVALARLLLLTGARLREVAECRWNRTKGNPLHPYLDPTGEFPVIVAVDHKGSRRQGPKAIPLSRAAQEVIKSIKAVEGSPYLFPSPVDPQKPLSNPHWNWLTVKQNGKLPKTLGLRDQAGLPHLRFHDLRHSFGALSVTLGHNPTVLSRIMGHATTQTTLDVYSHAEAASLYRAVDEVGQKIEDNTGR